MPPETKEPYATGEGSPVESVVAKIDALREELNETVAEGKHYVLGSGDAEFLEACKSLLHLGEEANARLGDLVWTALRDRFGSENADPAEKRNREARSTLSHWSAKLDIRYHKLYRLVAAAKTVALMPSVSNLPTTAQAEIGMAAGDTDAEKATRIGERLDSVNRIDPAHESSVEAVRQAKRAERNGIPRISIIQYPDLQFGGIEFAGLCAEGEVVPFYRLESIEPKDGNLIDQVRFYQQELVRRIRASHRDAKSEALPFDVTNDPEYQEEE